MQDTIDLVPVTRPNGKTYRPRKPPRAYECEDQRYGLSGVVVLGTHDIERAARLANGLLDEPVSLYPRRREWLRDGMSSGERQWMQDEVHGAPCVVFGAWVDPGSWPE
jgi:hypothetical protein